MKSLYSLVPVLLCLLLSTAAAIGQGHPEGIFVGIKELQEGARPDEDGFVWYHENTLTINGDSVFLTRSLMCYRDNTRYSVTPSPTTVSIYAGRIAGDGTIFLKIVQCDTCSRELRQNPETGVYEEVKDRGTTVDIRFEDDMVHLDGMVYMKKG